MRSTTFYLGRHWSPDPNGPVTKRVFEYNPQVYVLPDLYTREEWCTLEEWYALQGWF